MAESFGDIDPKTDTREADLEKGQKWTGWHQIEKAIWKTRSLKGEGPYAEDLVKNIETLKVRVGTASITATSMANGAKELLDEVATGKITGEEDAFSHTDLSDFKANVDGAQKVFDLLKPVVQEKDAGLSSDLTDEFAKVAKLLDKYNTPVQDRLHFASFDVVTEDRDRLIRMLKERTAAGAALTAGHAYGSAAGGLPASPPDDTGEALGLPPARLTLTVGFGPTLFESGGKDRFGLKARRLG